MVMPQNRSFFLLVSLNMQTDFIMNPLNPAHLRSRYHSLPYPHQYPHPHRFTELSYFLEFFFVI